MKALMHSADLGVLPSKAANDPGPKTTPEPYKKGLSHQIASRVPFLETAGIVAFLLIWQLLPSVGLVSEQVLPAFTTVAATLVTEIATAAFWMAVANTLAAWLLGLAIAIVSGVGLGFFVGSSPFLRKATHSTIEFLRPIPSVALIPVAILLFGIGIESALMLVVIASFWPVFIQMLYGVADVDSVADSTARSFGITGFSRIRFVVFPTALPYLMTGIRLSAAIALILAVTAGLVIGTPGLGSEVASAQEAGANERLYALALSTGVLGVAINLVTRRVERLVLRWHASVRSETYA
ncbi:ABC transporter permease [Pseudarthrobacter sp. NPDC058196]|uniref:ABC transporter permease n=1 Tax=Pseudarthrobacter sp. NPDC058196 TaxID=3346376 RepID=UPI0036D80377